MTFIAVTQHAEERMGGIRSYSLVALAVREYVMRAIINQRSSVGVCASGPHREQKHHLSIISSHRWAATVNSASGTPNYLLIKVTLMSSLTTTE